ncbi:hypothetical protein AVO44_19670 [Ruegeria profundi]|uniref:DUF2924 domain-containing protein n=1 Tax=Ruegeria profundi TaxID=1685378 RepID=A0A0X3TL17_9RHOB|nr:hypothetical protein AVO44_19670 [Ruegeria profundi]
MDRPALRVALAAAFGDAPPNLLSMVFIRKALIWDAQCRAFGELTTELKRALISAAGGQHVRTPKPAIKTGTHLMREWNGRRYQVEVREDGFVMNDDHYKSLSAIALQVTGTSWSGPRFFGLTSRAGTGA